MKYAVIQLAGKQFRVSEGDQITIDRVAAADWKNGKMTVKDVLLTRSDDAVQVGAPFVDGASVGLELVQDQKGEKIRVFKYKAKSRYRRTNGHRQAQTVVKVASIKA
jgi:large subunit ribosomal protein L21